ncbi:DNA topoisomerase VI subunit B [Vulcanisaeta thermophila]|uniref:DNA topoisomerase VI subunit B n=1 Tax=Vulcanisaeta thermophila TaxID=867917 RepID=UPI000853DA48|nr:DNA topoisomerase VI subunit B [Vulcanisaeta thermophila]
MGSIDVKFEALSPAEFFRRNREIAGFANPARAVYQTIRELVENSLDATETFKILPSIKIQVSYVDASRNWLGVYVEDNGIGIPGDEIPNVFGRVFYSSKYRIKQHRGIFGLGAKMVVLYAQSTTNMPITVRSAPLKSDVIYEYQVMIDIAKNEPVIVDSKTLENKYGWHGTAIKVVIEGDWPKAKRRVEEYLRRTSMIAPYAEFLFRGPDEDDFLVIPRVTVKMPEPPKEGLPHPKSVDVELIKQLIQRNPDMKVFEFLVENFDGVGESIARNFLDYAGVNPDMPVGELENDKLVNFVTKMREFNGWRRPRADWLSPIGEDILAEGVRSVLNPEVVFTVTRKPSSYMGNPFIVEAAIAWGGAVPQSDKPIIYRFANKVPLIYDEGNDVVRKIVDEIDWTQYKVKFPAQLAVVVHICSTKIPYASAGKEAIADVPEIESEIRNAIREVARKLRLYITRKEKEQELLMKYAVFTMYSEEVVNALSYVTNTDPDKLRRSMRELIARKLKLDRIERALKEGKLTEEGENNEGSSAQAASLD